MPYATVLRASGVECRIFGVPMAKGLRMLNPNMANTTARGGETLVCMVALFSLFFKSNSDLLNNNHSVVGFDSHCLTVVRASLNK